MSEVIPVKKLEKMLKAAEAAFKEKGGHGEWAPFYAEFIHNKLKEENEKGICEFC